MEDEGTATYPNFAGKHAYEAFFNPSDFVAYLRRSGRLDDLQAPEGIILCYQRTLFEHILKKEGAEQRGRLRGLVPLPSRNGRVGVLGSFGVGAPAAAAILEDWIALGSARFVSIGTAGSLQRGCGVGDVVVCERAIRDEGVSHHYLPSTKFAEASKELTARLASALTGRGIAHTTGCSWTIDTPYRETVEEARLYQSEGVLCVEMEAAALFAVAAYRSVEIASAFVISDSLADLVWEPQFYSDATATGLVSLYEAAVDVLDQA